MLQGDTAVDQASQRCSNGETTCSSKPFMNNVCRLAKRGQFLQGTPAFKRGEPGQQCIGTGQFHVYVNSNTHFQTEYGPLYLNLDQMG